MKAAGALPPDSAVPRACIEERRSPARRSPRLPHGGQAPPCALVVRVGTPARGSPAYRMCCLARSASSSGARSSWCVAIHQELPVGSFTPAFRSP